MSGRRRGVFAALIRAGLRFAEIPYAIAVAIRNRNFDRQPDRIHRVDVPVISVGNLTTGGTGKTPVVAFLAQWFRDRGIRVAIVSRGYGRGEDGENDEAKELHQRLPDVPHVQDADRVEAARITIEELETQLIVMDDGFQHRRLARDLDIVLIDLTCPFGYGHLLPRGLLREPLRSLKRADAVILTRCDLASQAETDAAIKTLRSHVPSLPIIRCTHRPSGLLTYPNAVAPTESLRGQRVAIVCGIGNPDAFRRTLEALGAVVVDQLYFPDHIAYDRQEVEQIDRWARGLNDVTRLMCTQKDWVKLRCDRLGGLPLAAMTIDAEIESSPEFDSLLSSLAERAEDADAFG
ncbi:tetraacyldisaccharide 4'-kinase [Roseiconus lacunae]|uniref:Tetraacyldisaccharide 4'-kinase n=1 Tax=Roseiconus lacunae TaxID=2605694 RepID=A0ABT7PMS2_9BACT|nr:tetraacyldisaccharide 4'-kinase [Roseiconus lacunae]MDM4017584.1 tetraacyldisaccharide 4'-kinase [Roseiconus lacunae]